MNPFEFVLAILGMVFLFNFLKQRNRLRHGLPAREEEGAVVDGSETRQLRDEVRQLKERVQVLERIAVEKEDTLSRQIEELRHR